MNYYINTTTTHAELQQAPPSLIRVLASRGAGPGLGQQEPGHPPGTAQDQTGCAEYTGHLALWGIIPVFS